MEGQGWELGDGSRVSRQLVRSLNLAREIEEEPVETPATAAKDKVHVAVTAELKTGKSTLLWAIRNNRRGQTFVLVHVHVPARMIPMMGGKFHISSLSGEQVNAYRQLEWDKTEKMLDEYITLCSRMKVRVEKRVIEKDDVAQGIVELIAELGITKLVMGAAADKHYSKRTSEIKSKTAIRVKEHGDPSCKIWFVCKGDLICTREASVDVSRIKQSPTANGSFISGHSEQSISRFSPSRKNELCNLLQNPLQDHSTHSSIDLAKIPNQDSRLRKPGTGSSTDHWEEISRISQRSDRLPASAHVEELSNSRSVSVPSDVDSEDWSASLCPVQGSEEDLQLSSLHHELQDLDSDVDILNKLQAALKELESLKHEAYEESCKHRRVEMQLILARQKAKASENLYAKEVKYRQEIEEALDREKLEVEKLKNQQAELLEQVQNANEQKVELELRLAESDHTSKYFEEKLEAACYRLHSIKDDYDVLQEERDELVKEAEELRQKLEQTGAGYFWTSNSEISNLELEQATQNFNNSPKIGEGRFGRVYKGFLRNTTVAIKILRRRSLHGRAEFCQEVAVLSRVRHPNLVRLIGACFDAFALIYEFLPNGSLEDCLACTDSNQPLTWKVRTRIIAEICSALIFLHSHKPHPVVHGDLKPANILLDADFVSKLGDFGIWKLLVQSNTSTTLYRSRPSNNTSTYIDPEFFITGEVTPQSDVYSFGIIILRLLTGKPAMGISGVVQEALNYGYLHAIIDPSAGDWAFVQAMQLAHLGLRCSNECSTNRPDLAEVWRVVEPMMKAALSSASPLSFGSFSDENHHTPSYFICPIFQEVMKDPHLAADGFTYEAEAIRGWIDSGHDTSPMTNLQLCNLELIPNRALRSAIQEWLQQQQQQQQP